MDIEKCKALLTVLDTGSLSAAANTLGYTPSGISRMMQSLEDEAGFPLLTRGRSGVAPTPECLQLLPVIRELARAGQLYGEKAAELRGVETGTVRIGCAYVYYYDWLARLIASFAKQHPGIEVEILQGYSTTLCQAVADHEADFVIASRREGAFDFIPLLRDPLVAVVPPEHPAVQKGVYAMKDFEKESFIGRSPMQGTDNDRAFSALGIQPNIRHRAVDERACLFLVAAGLGVTLDNRIIEQELDTREVRLLPTDPEWIVEIGIALPKKDDLSPAAAKFAAFAKERLSI
jgi:DNA-binding transcriptional LysR family regulator